MTDPGTVVGIVSLILQVSKGVVSYVDSVKDAKEQASSIGDQVDSLASLLELLESVVDTASAGAPKYATQAGILACSNALDKIKKQLAPWKCKKGSKASQILHDVKLRLSFSFKYETVMFCKDAMHSMQRNLNTALLVLEMEQRRVDTETVRLQLAQESQLIINNQSSINGQQQARFDKVDLQLTSNTDLIRGCLASFDRQTTSLGIALTDVKAEFSPVNDQISRLAETLPEVLSSMAKMEAKLDNLVPHAVSPKAIENNVSDMQKLSRGIRMIQSRCSTRNHARTSCKCHGQSDTDYLLQWPFCISRTLKRVHSSHCPYAAIEDAVTDLSLRFSMCSLTLRRKAQITVVLSRGAGATFVAPTLRTSRVVDAKSPAFKLIASFEEVVRKNPGPDTWRGPADKLYRLFAQRMASPHDRLSNGQTLLHYHCDRMLTFYTESAHSSHLCENFYYMARRIVDYMPCEALEKDDEGRTCVDIIIAGHNASLVEDLIDHGISTSIHLYLPKMNWDIEWAGTKFLDYDESCFDCSDRWKAVLFKSEARLREVIADKEYATNHKEDGYSLYELATSMGWRRGCEILLEHDIPIELGGDHEDLLSAAISSKQLDVLQFWLDIWLELDSDALACVGTLESTLDQIARSPRDEWLDAVILAITRQREELGSLASKHLDSSEFSITDRLLDAHAWKVYRDLEKRKVQLKSSLRPSRRSVYYYERHWLDALDALYDAGFRDITATDFSEPTTTSVSPLFFCATISSSMYNRDVAEKALWYIGKGVSLEECWPGSNSTLKKCLGWRLGYSYMRRDLFEGIKNNIGNLLPLFWDKAHDECNCRCSTSGCLFITMACKGLLTPDTHPGQSEYEMSRQQRTIRRETNDRLWTLVGWVADASTSAWEVEHWLVSQLIRLIVFSKLRIRHTCCDPLRIQHSGDPDFDVSPYPRHARDEIERIEEEDQELYDVLEELVVEYEALYEGFEDSLYHFFEQELIPDIEKRLVALKQDDLERFAMGRRRLGIVMELGGDEDESTESGETSGSDGDDDDDDGSDDDGDDDD